MIYEFMYEFYTPDGSEIEHANRCLEKGLPLNDRQLFILENY